MKNFVVTIFVLFLTGNSLIAAEAGMPQLDPKYWASQSFWLIIIFLSIYFLIGRVFIPKIKSNIDAREDKIRKDLEEAKSLQEQAEQKLKEYNKLVENAKIEAKKIVFESRQKLNSDIATKRKEFEKTIETELKNAEKEIRIFKRNSINKVNVISEDIVSNLIKEIFGDDLNQSSIKATVTEITKKHKFDKA